MKTTVITLLLFIGFSSYSQETYDLTILVKNFGSTDGKVLVGLYDTEEDFMKNAIAGADTVVYNQEMVTLTFKNLTAGVYAFSLYHDSNENGELDSNFFGMPKEGFAFSNNAMGMFGPPDFEESSFEINSDITQTITLKQL